MTGSGILRPLDGLRVAEIGGAVSAAFAARILGDLGAEIIKIEPPGGDPCRGQGPFLTGADRQVRSALFGYLNAGKRCVAIDFAAPDAAGLVASLLDRSDLVLWSAGAEVGPALNELVAPARPGRPTTVRISAFGLKGARAGQAGSDYVAQHSGGYAYHQACPVTDPTATGPVGCADREAETYVGLVIANAALWAISSVAADGPKPFVDFSAEDAFAYLLVDALADLKEGRLPPGRQRAAGQGITIAGGLVWFLPCADGAIMVSPREDHQWARWVELMGNPDWANDPALCGSRAIRTAKSSRLQELMTAWSVEVKAHEIFARAQAARVACFPVSTPPDLIRNRQLEARGFFDRLTVPGGEDVRMPGLPFEMRSSGGSSLPRGRARAVPGLEMEPDARA